MARMQLKKAVKQFATVDRGPEGPVNVREIIRQHADVIRDMIQSELENVELDTDGDGGGCGGGCGGGERGSFGAYAPAGTLVFESTGANDTDEDSISVTGDNLPGDSLILFVSHRTAGGVDVPRDNVIVTSIKADNQPVPIGDGGAPAALADISEFNATGLSTQVRARKTLTVSVQFGPNSANGDKLIAVVMAKGALSLRDAMCEIPDPKARRR